MPEGVDGHTTGDAELGGGAVDGATDSIRAQLLARVLPREHQRPWRFGQPPVVAQGFEQPLRQRDQARAVTFAVADVDEPRLSVNVPAFERQDL
jgi:hypothetical protein